jgi:hypothetical protein
VLMAFVNQIISTASGNFSVVLLVASCLGFCVVSFKRYDERRWRLPARSAADAHHRKAGKKG